MYTDETRASLDGQDRWEHGWVLKGEKITVVTTRQNKEGALCCWLVSLMMNLTGHLEYQMGLKMKYVDICLL